MDTAEVQQLLDDLEPRIERLKSLYQQYFMGIEKIPPHVLRKDVERSLWRLRRQRLQTTRLRFKFQQIVQRYNTYQQQWARIMRDIERGTFKRDVVRAAKRFGHDEALAEVGRAARAALEHDLRDEPTPAPTTWELDEEFGAITPMARPDSDLAPAPRTWELSDEDVLPGLSAATGPKPVPAPAPTPAPAAPKEAPPPAMAPKQAPPPAMTPKRAVGAPPGLRPAPPIRPPPPPPRPDATAAVTGEPRRPPLPRREVPPPPRAAAPAPPPASPAPKPRPDPAPAQKPGADRTRKLFDEYLRARRASGEAVDKLSYDALERSLQRQTERLRQKHGNREVDYEVVTKDGRALIRPVLK